MHKAKVLMTGAAGIIGSAIRARLARVPWSRYAAIRLLDLKAA